MNKNEDIKTSDPFIRRYFELLEISEKDCHCGKVFKCVSCEASSTLNELNDIIRTSHGRLTKIK